MLMVMYLLRKDLEKSKLSVCFTLVFNRLHPSTTPRQFFFFKPKDVTRLPQVQNVSVVLESLAWLCDGQNEEMQKVLQQKDLYFNVGYERLTHCTI